MNAMIWNIRFKTQRAFERLILMHREHKFQFIGSMEPKQQGKKLEKYRRKIDFPLAISNVSNKIWAFFSERFEVTVVMDMVQQLTLKVFDIEDQQEFYLTMVYAKCDAIERTELWDSLYALGSDMNLPWIVGGDFNVIWDKEEKFGGFPVHINEVDDFRHCIDTSNLFYLGFKGSIYTWWNGRAEENCIFKRLDRCLANLEFQNLWPGIEVEHLTKIGSDHSPLLIKLSPEVAPIKKSFRFLNFWLKHESFHEVVRQNWQADFFANPFTMFNHKLKKLKKVLSIWSKATYGDIFQKLSSLEEVVKVHEAQFVLRPTLQNRERLQRVQADLFKVMALEEEYWKQKSGMAWFQNGDRNTKFIHAQVRGRRKCLLLKRIQASNGMWLEEQETIAEEAVRVFTAQFHEDAMPNNFDIINHIPQLITPEQNLDLIRQPTCEEVKQAVLD
ncbi:uncharacterized protein [Nicotiana sylvestris]